MRDKKRTEGVSVKLTAAEWEIAKRVCSPRQLTALDLWRRGAGSRRIGVVLGIDRSTAREHVKRALEKITDELELNA